MTNYDDRIFANTSTWISTNVLCRLVKGDKSHITIAIKHLLERGYLEKRTDGYIIEYRRIDKAQSNDQFDDMMTNFEDNKQTAVNEIVLHNYPILTKKGKLTKKADDLLDWIQTQLLDMAFLVMIRLKYQDTLKLLPHSVVNKRLQTIQNFIDSVMESLKPLKNEKLILERFQTHTHKLEPFKV